MNNAEVQYGDNIIIYFAGHGSGYSTAGDREINTIFQNICHAKGHHITFILDCSHAWITTEYPEQGIRTLPPLSNGSPKHMFSVADEYCRQLLCYQSVYSDRWCPDMSSHVVIAACQEHQVVTETRKEGGIQGAFTDSLVGILDSRSFSERSTYIDLLLAFPMMHGQTPVIAGTHKNTQIWYQD
ncbi:hypothetical protein IW261DRAFT_1515168 [Armillaria novae-zelandiae]|uniref:Peptidase C14 caspase domain-containing protein n=1 Tax=Armillaria novae-zelandiae TaxID=153914 RepID=A0AA39NRX1_9AGAR|nr:hypothetical protein IW261DRAFT_1515168 [Armillaria novae-zelandiae]